MRFMKQNTFICHKRIPFTQKLIIGNKTNILIQKQHLSKKILDWNKFWFYIYYQMNIILNISMNSFKFLFIIGNQKQSFKIPEILKKFQVFFIQGFWKAGFLTNIYSIQYIPNFIYCSNLLNIKSYLYEINTLGIPNFFISARLMDIRVNKLTYFLNISSKQKQNLLLLLMLVLVQTIKLFFKKNVIYLTGHKSSSFFNHLEKKGDIYSNHFLNFGTKNTLFNFLERQKHQDRKYLKFFQLLLNSKLKTQIFQQKYEILLLFPKRVIFSKYKFKQKFQKNKKKHKIVKIQYLKNLYFLTKEKKEFFLLRNKGQKILKQYLNIWLSFQFL